MKKDVYKLTNPQKNIWNTEQFHPNTSINTVCGTSIVHQKLDTELLKEAFYKVLKMNDSFNLKFIFEDFSLKQYLSNSKTPEVPVIYVENLSQLDEVRKEIISKPFKIIDSNLYQFYIFNVHDEATAYMLSTHHLISDSWSLGLFCKEILRVYIALQNNPLTNFENNPSYIDYIKSEEAYLNSEKFEKDQEFWLSKFEIIPEGALIPGSADSSIASNVDSRVTHNSVIASRKKYSIDNNLMEKITSFAKKHKISNYHFFMAIYAIYIGKICNLNDFIIGTPILNRTNFKDKHTLGMFISTVPFNIHINQNQRFLDFVSTISTDLVSILRHQKYPYSCLLEELRKNHPSLPNLYNTFLSYQITNTQDNSFNLPYDADWAFNGYSSDLLQIHLYDLNSLGSLTVSYDYQLSHYTQKDIEDIHTRILYLISQVLEKPDLSLSEYEIVTPKEKQKLLCDFNNTSLSYDETIPYITHFEKQVALTPSMPALIFEGKTLTFQELNESANRLAHFLRNQGVTRNTIVGILEPRSFEMIFAMLAVLKAGGAYIPIDPDYPADRISYMLEDSKSAFLLTNSELIDSISFSGEKFDISMSNSSVYNFSSENLEPISKPDDLSYLIYTSGSTGMPKGVMLTQKSLSNFYASMSQKIEYLKENTSSHSMLSITTFSFDIFVFESLISLARGVKVYLTNYYEQKITSKLEKLIANNQIDTIQTTPSVMQFHLDNLENKEDLSSLKYITLAGEQLPKKLINQLKHICPNVTIYNGYGPSETTIFSTLDDVTNVSKVTIGKPISNTQIYILNDSYNLLPIGISGEIYIAGDGVGKGYLYKEDLTKERYLTNPFHKDSIMYKSGDIGFWNEDGTITCKGRSDHQVKLRGLRVELGEIEEKINNYRNIEGIQCATIIKKIQDIDYICAFIQTQVPIDEMELKAYLLKVLPNYMIPSYFIFLDKLPKTPNGKIDKKALQNYETTTSNREIVLPKTDTEKQLYSIICDLLHTHSFSMESDLFSLGMDSLMVIQLLARIMDAFKVNLSIEQVYSCPSILALSKQILSSQKEEIVQIKPAPESDSYPLTEEQLSIFYSMKMSSENSLLYNVSGGILIDSVLDVKKVENIFKEIINHHSSFRTCFQFMAQTPRQIVLPSVDFSVEVLYGNSENLSKIVSEFPKPFVLENAPLLRVAVCFLENQKTLLLLDSHHIILDGTSMDVLLEDFCELYENNSLKEKKLQYIDFSMWEKDYMESDFAANAKDYWVKKLGEKELPVLAFPYDYSPSETSYEGDTITAEIPEAVFSQIEKLAKQEGVSTYMMFLAIFYLLLYNYTSQENILVGIPMANRPSSMENVIGMFVNNAVLDVNINSKLTFSEFLKQIKLTVLEAMQNQPYPYHALVKNLNLNGKNIFDVMFIYQNEHNKEFLLEGKPIEVLYANTHTSKFNLSMEVLPNDRKIQLEYRTNLIAPSTANSFMQHYLHLLETVSNYLPKKLSDFDILLESEKNIILNDFNQTDISFDMQKDLVDLFEEKVKEFPNAVAVIFQNNHLTYNELNKNANQLGHYLSSIDINENDVISIVLNRSFDLIIAIYAVLKCGASYVLIDPSFPKERIDYIMKNSNSKYCITSTDLSIESKIPCINIDKFKYYHYSTHNLVENSRSPQLCMIYTSGSTGNPKGVCLHKKGFINLLYAFDHDMAISSYLRILGIATVSFDMFAVELFSSLSFGNTLVLANEEEQKNVIAMSNLIRNHNVEFLVTTPSRIELLLLEECKNPLKVLKTILLGGERFTPTLFERLNQVTKAKIFNGYGPTEITACCSDQLVVSNDITIGKPLPNVQIYICNSDMNLCPIGIVGQICVAGAGVSNGYIANPEANNKSFIPNPFGKGMLYKTGDLGKFRPNGEIEYIGRSDFQVKIRGLRIELSEIEMKLNSLDIIDQSTVLYNNHSKFPYLIAFVTSKDTVNIHDVKTKLSKNLPSYMIPRYIVQLDNLPITLNGKIDRKALENYQLSSDDSDFRETYVPPKTEKQKLFCQIWSSLLNTEVGIDDDLFVIGADSLLAIRFKTQLLAYDIDLPYADIFQYRTVRELCHAHTSDPNKMNSLSSFNYLDINQLLKNQSDSEVTHSSSNNALLLGSTGFVGMHIINSFIKNTTGKIYCIVRDKNNLSAKTRFMDLLHFYFGDSLDNFIDERIFILKGSVVKENFGLSNLNYQMIAQNCDVVINAAANVKHFGSMDKFKNINIDALNISTSFCLNYHKRFIHISSLSVSGNMIFDGSVSNISNSGKKTFTEKNLFIGQTLDNMYSRSKFEAERLILDKIVHENLNAQILRLGNITNRFSDGKFQVNPQDNGFANRLKSFVKIKVFPDYLLNDYIDFTPVDLCADAIIQILIHNSKNRYIYHIYNDNYVYFSELLGLLRNLNISIESLSETEFIAKIDSILADKKSLDSISGIINDFGINRKLDYSSYVDISGEYSKSELSKYGFVWPKIDLTYLKKYISYLRKIKFIN